MKGVFTFDTVKVKEEDVIKGKILKTVTSIFDPVGFVASFLVRGKTFLQELWRLKVNWDNRITKSQCKQGKVEMGGSESERGYNSKMSSTFRILG